MWKNFRNKQKKFYVRNTTTNANPVGVKFRLMLWYFYT